MAARIFVIFAGPALIAMAVFVVLGFLWWPFFALAPIVAGGVVVWFWWRAEDAVLDQLDARPLGQVEQARIANVVERLSLTTGIVEPELQAVDTKAINLAVVSGRAHALVATTGLLESFGPMEMEGVVAHAMSKIETGASEYETLIASAPWAVTPMQRRWAHGWAGGDDGVIRFDLGGVGLTRYPPGLRSALETIGDSPTEVAGGKALGNAWLVPPMPERTPIEQRIRVLWEL